MTFEKCTKRTRVSKVKVEEENAKVIFNNETRSQYYVTEFDGCTVSNATAADFVVRKERIGQIVVELKGTEVDKAVEQITKTVDFLRDNDLRIGRLAGLIVGRRRPKFDTKFQRASNEFSDRFRAPLRLKTDTEPAVFERCLEF